jgi:hypothetical protein
MHFKIKQLSCHLESFDFTFLILSVLLNSQKNIFLCDL